MDDETPVSHLDTALRYTSLQPGWGFRVNDEIATTVCGHIEAVTHVKHPRRRECAECVKIGGWWVHLRTCQTCGATLCCDDSPHRHASRHAHETHHPVIASAEPGERWLYCYVDELTVGY